MEYCQESIKAKIKSKIEKHPITQCHNWLGSLDADGYPRISIGMERPRAHRVSYIVNKGEIPKGMVVMHSCDNPKCVNPKHLSLGTQGDNIREAALKGRMGRSFLKNSAPSRSMRHGRVVIATSPTEMLVFHRWHSALCMGFKKGPMMRAARGIRGGFYKGYKWSYA